MVLDLSKLLKCPPTLALLCARPGGYFTSAECWGEEFAPDWTYKHLILADRARAQWDPDVQFLYAEPVHTGPWIVFPRCDWTVLRCVRRNPPLCTPCFLYHV